MDKLCKNIFIYFFVESDVNNNKYVKYEKYDKYD